MFLFRSSVSSPPFSISFERDGDTFVAHDANSSAGRIWTAVSIVMVGFGAWFEATSPSGTLPIGYMIIATGVIGVVYGVCRLSESLTCTVDESTGTVRLDKKSRFGRRTTSSPLARVQVLIGSRIYRKVRIFEFTLQVENDRMTLCTAKTYDAMAAYIQALPTPIRNRPAVSVT